MKNEMSFSNNHNQSNNILKNDTINTNNDDSKHRKNIIAEKNKNSKKESSTTENELINLAKKGDKQAIDEIVLKYSDAVNIKANKYYINGAEKDDLIQEGYIGLFKAIKNFKPEEENSFKNFANLCIERQIITAVKGSNRQKHIPLNSYISLNNTTFENEDGEQENSLIDILSAETVEDPLETITKSEYYKNIETSINNSLSKFEKQVLNEYIKGKSYVEIAKDLQSDTKAIDNAIQRIRKKTEKNLKNI